MGGAQTQTRQRFWNRTPKQNLVSLANFLIGWVKRSFLRIANKQAGGFSASWEILINPNDLNCGHSHQDPLPRAHCGLIYINWQNEPALLIIDDFQKKVSKRGMKVVLGEKDCKRGADCWQREGRARHLWSRFQSVKACRRNSGLLLLKYLALCFRIAPLDV